MYEDLLVKGLRKLAMGLPRGSAQQYRVIKILAGAWEEYTTQGGVRFKIQHREFANYLGKQGLRGTAMGVVLRGEEPIRDDEVVTLVKSYGAKLMRGPRPKNMPSKRPEKKFPDINDLWTDLVKAIHTFEKPDRNTSADYFLQMPEPPQRDKPTTLEGWGQVFREWLEGISGDVGKSYEYALSGRTGKALKTFKDAILTGEYSGRLNNPSWRYWDYRLQEIYASAWYTAMLDGWDKISDKRKRELVVQKNQQYF